MKKCTALKSKKVQGILGETFILVLSSPAVFRLQNRVSDWVSRAENASYRNRTEKQIMPFQTKVNWLFNDILCYLVIGYFD